MTDASNAALRHLKKIKPLDGWSVEKSGKGYRLLRRNVPLSDNFFLDVHHDATSGAVVGILTTRRGGKAQAQVLVDADGKPTSKPRKLLQVAGWEPSVFPRSAQNTTEESSVPVLSDEQNMQLIKFGVMGIAGLVLFKVLLQGMMVLYVLALPILYLYLVQNCPSDASFDAKKELKRVMRGHHLPEDHPAKPKGFLSETFARLNAAVTTEVATSLGYEVSLISLAGAIKIACVRVPAAKMDYYWVGAAGRWTYVYGTEVNQD